MPEQNEVSPALLVDGHGRTVHYLRISVTDRCNLCCRYCRDEGVPFIPHEKILRFEEIEKIIEIAIGLGVHKLRFTGGEPFARKGFLDFLVKIHDRFPHIALKLTTNGTLLAPALETLKALDVSVNLSLDSLDREKYAAITGRDELPTVLGNMHRMLELGIPLKINAVAMRGVNDVELHDLASMAMDWPVDVRFIEFMPMGDSTIWSNNLFWPAADILETARGTRSCKTVEARYAGRPRFKRQLRPHHLGHAKFLPVLQSSAADGGRQYPHLPFRRQRISHTGRTARQGRRRSSPHHDRRRLTKTRGRGNSCLQKRSCGP